MHRISGGLLESSHLVTTGAKNFQQYLNWVHFGHQAECKAQNCRRLNQHPRHSQFEQQLYSQKTFR